MTELTVVLDLKVQCGLLPLSAFDQTAYRIAQLSVYLNVTK